MDFLPSLEGLRDNLWSSILVALLVFVGASMMTWWIKRRHQVQHYVSPPFLVLLGIGIVGLVSWTIVGVKYLIWGSAAPVVVVSPFILPSSPTVEPVVTLSTPSEELREIIRKWLDDFHFQIRSNEREDAHFSFTVQGTGRNRFEILRMKKEREQFITILGLLKYNEDDQRRVESLPGTERQCIFTEIEMELRRQKVISSSKLPESILIQSRIPIPELTQARLLDRIDDVDYAMGLTTLKFSTLVEYGECRNKAKGELSKNSLTVNRKQ